MFFRDTYDSADFPSLLQGPFVREVSQNVSGFINRMNQNPLNTASGQFGLGYLSNHVSNPAQLQQGGARSVAELMDFPPVSARGRRAHRRPRKTQARKRRQATSGGSQKAKRRKVSQAGGRRRKARSSKKKCGRKQRKGKAKRKQRKRKSGKRRKAPVGGGRRRKGRKKPAKTKRKTRTVKQKWKRKRQRSGNVGPLNNSSEFIF